VTENKRASSLILAIQKRRRPVKHLSASGIICSLAIHLPAVALIIVY
jgi:hypothetical protein